MWFERVYVWLCAIERNVLYPLTFVNCTTRYARSINEKFGSMFVFLIIPSSTDKQYSIPFRFSNYPLVLLLQMIPFCDSFCYVWFILFHSSLDFLIFLDSKLPLALYFSHFRFGPLVITVTGMKLLRSSFTSVSRQHIILIWTVLFFEFDYQNHSETFPIDYFIMSIFVDKVS